MKGPSVKEYVDYILLRLGSSVVTVEIEEDIPKVVDEAFNEIKHYITDTRTITIPYSNKIDLKGKNISSVIYVMRNKSNLGGNLCYFYPGYSSRITTTDLSDYASAFLVNRNLNEISTDLDFYHDKAEDVLYVYANNAKPVSITLVYIPIYESVEDIVEPFWQNLLKRMSLAMTKEILGRIRGKYSLNSATYNLDSDKLLAEAQVELSEIRAYLNENSDMLLPID